MQEAFICAKSRMAETQLARKNKREFLTFIHNTRESISNLLYPVEQFDENNYGVSIPETIEGVFLKDIDAERDLHISDAEGLSMDVFIGKQKVGKFSAWYLNKFHMEPSMYVDVAVNHKNVPKITNQVFIIHGDTIELWNRKKDPDNADHAEYFPPGQSENTRLITDVLDYAAKHAKPSQSRK